MKSRVKNERGCAAEKRTLRTPADQFAVQVWMKMGRTWLCLMFRLRCGANNFLQFLTHSKLLLLFFCVGAWRCSSFMMLFLETSCHYKTMTWCLRLKASSWTHLPYQSWNEATGTLNGPADLSSWSFFVVLLFCWVEFTASVRLVWSDVLMPFGWTERIFRCIFPLDHFWSIGLFWSLD